VIMRILSAAPAARLVCVLTLCVVAVYPTVAVAQNGTRAPADRMAVIDLKYILEHHQSFRAKMEQVKQNFETAREQLKVESQSIVEAEKLLSKLNVGTLEFDRQDEAVAQRKADWTVKANKLKKDIRNQESQILWEVYQEIIVTTTQYCQQNGIGLVLQFNGEEIDPNKTQNPQQVVGMMSRPIVYNSRHLDITGWILKALNERGGSPRVSASPPKQGVPR